MATLLSAKDILLGYDVFAIKDEKGKIVKRGTSHEFQDYAYRLASDLNDLEHLRIYMKFAKTIPRYVLDRTYEFVADSNTDQKAKLFMWKLKQVRKELQKQKDILNFESGHTYKKIQIARNNFAKDILKKNDNFETNFLAKILYENKLFDLNLIDKLLFVGNDSSLLPSVFIPKVKKVFGIDSSSKLTSELKKIFSNSKNAKFVTKDFFKNTFKKKYFDLLVINKFWQCITLDEETKFLEEIKKLLNPSGLVVIGINHSEKDSQKWTVKEFKGEEFLFFEKNNSKENFEEKLEKINFKVKNVFENKNQVYYVINNS